MEILFVGGLLVALMVYVSTRIKKSAAAAFEREMIETESFRLVKPEGFINPVVENSKYAFEARSKDYGESRAGRDIPRANFTLSVLANGDFEKVCREAKDSSCQILSENLLTENTEGEKKYLLEAEQNSDDTERRVYRKIVENQRQQKVYDLKLSVLQEFRDEYNDKINEILEGFGTK
jgi:hypothetical protein